MKYPFGCRVGIGPDRDVAQSEMSSYIFAPAGPMVWVGTLAATMSPKLCINITDILFFLFLDWPQY